MLTKKVIEIVSSVLKVDSSKLSITSKQSDFKEWDSLTQLMIIKDIEGEFNIQIEDRVIKNLNSVKNICQHIKKLINSKKSRILNIKHT